MRQDCSRFFPRGAREAEWLDGFGVFVHGARRSGKSSLAFQAAVGAVMKGESVLVLCSEAALCARVPQPFDPLHSLDEASLRRIEFVYVVDWPSVAHELMHTFPLYQTAGPRKLLVMIDDGGFSGMAEAELSAAQAMMAQSISLLINAQTWLHPCGCCLDFVVISNAVPEARRRLPLSAFPLVSVWVGSSGMVEFRGAGEAADSPRVQARIAWADGLKLCP